LANISRRIEFDKQFIVFYANIGQEFLAMFPQYPEVKKLEDRIIELTSENKDIQVYTLW